MTLCFPTVWLPTFQTSSHPGAPPVVLTDLRGGTPPRHVRPLEPEIFLQWSNKYLFERFFLSRSLYFAHKIIFWVTCFDLLSLSNTDLRNRTYETILRSVHIVSCPLIYKTKISWWLLHRHTTQSPSRLRSSLARAAADGIQISSWGVPPSAS